MLKKNKKEIIKICCDEINLDTLSEFDFCDAFVIVACPRIAIDNQEKIKRPLLTYIEIKSVFENKPYVFDEIK